MTGTHRRLTRRSLLRGTAGAVLGLLIGGVARTVAPQRLLASRLRAMLIHREAAAILGVAYLTRHPAESSSGHLVAALAAGTAGGVGRLERADTRRLKALMAERIRADYRAGRIVVLHGWVVSVTEARLAALVVTS